MNVLVVDDNQHMRNLVKAILHSLGVRNVRDAADGSDALKIMRFFAADMVLCDWNMEPLDGLEFLRLVREAKDSPNPRVPVIMLTGHTEMHRVLAARAAGVTDFLAKPISPRSRFLRLHKVLGKAGVPAGRMLEPAHGV